MGINIAYVCTCIFIHLLICTHTYLYLHTYVCTSTDEWLYMCIYIKIDIHIYMYINTHLIHVFIYLARTLLSLQKRRKFCHLWKHDLRARLTVMSLLFHGTLPHHIYSSLKGGLLRSLSKCYSMEAPSRIASSKTPPSPTILLLHPRAEPCWGLRNTFYTVFSFLPPSAYSSVRALLGSLCPWTPSVKFLDGFSFWGNTNFR